MVVITRSRVVASNVAEPVESLPFDVMERIADFASPMTILNLQLANKEWAAACKGQLRKYADVPVENILELSREDFVDLLEKGEWTREYDDRNITFKTKLDCFANYTRMVINFYDVYGEGLRARSYRKRILKEFNYNKKEVIDASIMCNMAYVLTTFPKRDESLKLFMRRCEIKLGYVYEEIVRQTFRVGAHYIFFGFWPSHSPNEIWETFFEENMKDIRGYLKKKMKSKNSIKTFERQLRNVKISIR